jgi:hypothetical protein
VTALCCGQPLTYFSDSCFGPIHSRSARFDYDIYFHRPEARLIERAARICGLPPRAFLYNIVLGNAAHIVKHGHICGKKRAAVR